MLKRFSRLWIGHVVEKGNGTIEFGPRLIGARCPEIDCAQVMIGVLSLSTCRN